MPVADTAKLIAALTLKDGFTGPLKNANKALNTFDAKLTKTQGRGYLAGQQIGTGIKNGAKLAAVGLGILATQVVAGLNQLSQLEEQTAATNAALASTKGVSGQTAESVRALAEQYENLNAIIDDKVIQSGENVLLTFTNIRKEAFEPALAAALDLSTAMGQDLQQSIVQVGKALNDPAKGFTALRRVGIQFTADQEKQIKSLQKSGDLLGAQKIILGELGTEFGGRFAAQGKTATGTIAGIGDAVEDLQKAVATGLFPVIQKLLPRVREFLANPTFIRGATELGDKIASLFSDDNITAGANALQGVFRTAKSVAPAIESAAKITGQVIKTAVDLFKSLPPEIQALAISGLAINKLTGGLVTNIAGGLISAVISSFKGLMNVNAAVVNVNGAVSGVPGAGAVPAAAATGLSGLQKVFLVGEAIGLALAVNQVRQGISDQSTAQAHSITEQTNKFVATQPPREQLVTALNAVKTGIHDLEFNPLNVLVQGDALDQLRGLRTDLTTKLAATLGHAVNEATKDRDQGPQLSNAAVKDRDQSLKVVASKLDDIQAQGQRTTAAIRDADSSIRAVQSTDRRTPAQIGGYIDRMKGVLASRAAATTRAVRAQKNSVTVNVKAQTATYINGRLLDANTNRFKSTIVGSRGAFAEFG
jgi:hypothetical protein